MHWSHPLHRAETEYLQYLQSYLEFFSCHLEAAEPLLKTDHISPVCRYIMEIWPAWAACICKNGSARGDGPLCAQHCALSFVWCRATWWMQETKLNRQNYRDFPLHSLSFAHWFPTSRSRFPASHHAPYCVRRSLTSWYRPVVHLCSHFGASVSHSDMLRETARVLQQVPKHFDCAIGFLFVLLVALISFI